MKKFALLLFLILTLLLAVVSIFMAFTGLGMLSFLPGVPVLIFSFLLSRLHPKWKKMAITILGLVAFSLAFTFLKSKLFEPKLAEDAQVETELTSTEEELINDDLSEAFSDFEFEEPTVKESIPEDRPLLSPEALYTKHCASCHQADGQGIAGKYPPLAQSDYLESRLASIDAIINGLKGEVVVNNAIYKQEMPAAPLNNKELVSVINYIFSSWGNDIKATNLTEIENIKKVAQ